MRPATEFDEEAAVTGARIQAGPRVAVIGSTVFWHKDSEQICADIGQGLAELEGIVLLTGGVAGAGECVGRGYAKACHKLGRSPTVVHVLPRGCGAWDYGVTLFAGDSMEERREILGRLASVFVVVEGGPGTEHEATVAAAHGASLIPVGRSGGHAGVLHPRLQSPPDVDARDWEALGNPAAAPEVVAAAVVKIVMSCVRHDL